MTLPPEAFPYRIDPTSTYYVDAGNDDGSCGAKNTFYPPTSIEFCWDGGSSEWIIRNLDSGEYKVYVGLVRINTAGIPNDAVVTSAQLKLYTSIGYDGDGRSFSGEYYSAANWPINGGDYTATAAETAFAGVDIGSLASPGYTTFTLLNPNSNLSKTGDTGFRLHITGGQPSGHSQVSYKTYENGGGYKPYLVVTYGYPTTMQLIVVSTD
jgi:hypothetical protein